jgi:hypothetical protein
MATSIQAQILEHLITLKEDVAEIKAIVPTVKKLDEVVRTGNGKPPMTKRLEDVEVYVECEKAAEKQRIFDKKETEEKAADKKADEKSKIKLQLIGSIIGFTVVTIGGWIVAYIYIFLPLLPHK